MKNREQYINYKNTLSNKILILQDKYHSLRLREDELSSYILDNIKYIKDEKIKKLIFNAIDDNSYGVTNLYKITKQYNPNSKEFKLLINTIALQEIKRVTIKSTLEQYTYFVYLYNIPYDIYSDIVFSFFEEVSNSILKGNKFMLINLVLLI